MFFPRRYDRGEQLMKKINNSVNDLQEQLTVEVPLSHVLDMPQGGIINHRVF